MEDERNKCAKTNQTLMGQIHFQVVCLVRQKTMTTNQDLKWRQRFLPNLLEIHLGGIQ